MTSILGNQEQRKSKIDTEKWKEHKEYYTNPNNFKKKTIPIKEPKNLEQKLTYDSIGDPRLILIPIKDIFVHTLTQEKYDTLMQVYESAGWKWADGETPTGHNKWTNERSQTIISAYDRQSMGTFQSFIDRSTRGQINQFVISPERFYEKQNITPEILKELNAWYDTNKPNRASKG